MKILKIEQSIYVKTNGKVNNRHYTRYSADKWTIKMWNNEVVIGNPNKLEKLYQEFVRIKNEYLPSKNK